jgi:hypothetical protein
MRTPSRIGDRFRAEIHNTGSSFCGVAGSQRQRATDDI